MTDKQTRFEVQNMKCNGCEAAAREAVSKLEGFEDASFDHTSGMGVVTGAVDPHAVEEALTAIGYPAKAKE